MKTISALRWTSLGIIPLAGSALLAALLGLLWLPSLSGEGVFPFLVCFSAAGLAYLAALQRLPFEKPPMWIIWLFALLFRLVLLATPLGLSDDVYRYAWDGHLLNLGINPYAQPVNSTLLDAVHIPLREQVDYPWMATPYLPAAQLYFALVTRVAPQSLFALRVAAVLLDLAAGWLVLAAMRQLHLPGKAVLVTLWNPLVVVEFAHGAHVDALMLFFLAGGLLLLLRSRPALAALALAAAVLVKGWPLLILPLFLGRLGLKRTLLLAGCVLLPLTLFAAGAGWGLWGPADGRGVFGALRIYAASWQFNPGLYQGIAWLLALLVGYDRAAAGARLAALALPGLVSVLLAWRARQEPDTPFLMLVRQAALVLGLYLLLSPTVHPWYSTVVLLLLPFFWPSPGENPAVWRWIWPWVYFTFFCAFTYLAYSGLPSPSGLWLVQLAAYLPFWGLLAWSTRFLRI